MTSIPLDQPMPDDEVLGISLYEWNEHARSRFDLCIEAIESGQWGDAVGYAGQAIEDTLEPNELFSVWPIQIRDFLIEHGVPLEAVAKEEALLDELFLLPGERAFELAAEWREVCRLIESTQQYCREEKGEKACAALEEARLHWMKTHDRACDRVQALGAMAAEYLGEQITGELWDVLMAPMFEEYRRYDVDVNSWPKSAQRLLLVTSGALRGHLTGEDRRGDIEFVREPGRIGYRFRPCGSGGRNFNNTTIGNYPLTTQEYDWAWNQKGVCLYCAHCCALSERNPIATFGYPARVVEPPFKDGQEIRNYCTWWVYEDPRTIPEEVYQRTGNEKPLKIGSEATQYGKNSADIPEVIAATKMRIKP